MERRGLLEGLVGRPAEPKATMGGLEQSRATASSGRGIRGNRAAADTLETCSVETRGWVHVEKVAVLRKTSPASCAGAEAH